jgi:hypothetical protein
MNWDLVIYLKMYNLQTEEIVFQKNSIFKKTIVVIPEFKYHCQQKNSTFKNTIKRC